MFKKIIISALIALSLVSSTMAQDESSAPPANGASSTRSTTLLPNIEYGKTTGPTKIALVGNLPSQRWQVILGQVIQIVLGIVGSLTIVAFTVGGVMMVVARGNEDEISKGKKIILWSIMALIVIAASYGLVLGVTQLNFF